MSLLLQVSERNLLSAHLATTWLGIHEELGEIPGYVLVITWSHITTTMYQPMASNIQSPLLHMNHFWTMPNHPTIAHMFISSFLTARLLQPIENRVSIGAIYIDFGEEGEGYPISVLGKVLDLCFRSRLLASKLRGRKCLMAICSQAGT
jgi:hypothetical protein